MYVTQQCLNNSVLTVVVSFSSSFYPYSCLSQILLSLVPPFLLIWLLFWITDPASWGEWRWSPHAWGMYHDWLVCKMMSLFFSIYCFTTSSNKTSKFMEIRPNLNLCRRHKATQVPFAMLTSSLHSSTGLMEEVLPSSVLKGKNARWTLLLSQSRQMVVLSLRNFPLDMVHI